MKLWRRSQISIVKPTRNMFQVRVTLRNPDGTEAVDLSMLLSDTHSDETLYIMKLGDIESPRFLEPDGQPRFPIGPDTILQLDGLRK